mmetsp:Transcript_42975/g.100822  ORF Transcript_42975/g.100822 Transcript_42975/m.100822 type:complete len:331 (-) Transcript_42975:79-1071(-)
MHADVDVPDQAVLAPIQRRYRRLFALSVEGEEARLHWPLHPVHDRSPRARRHLDVDSGRAAKVGRHLAGRHEDGVSRDLRLAHAHALARARGGERTAAALAHGVAPLVAHGEAQLRRLAAEHERLLWLPERWRHQLVRRAWPERLQGDLQLLGAGRQRHADAQRELRLPLRQLEARCELEADKAQRGDGGRAAQIRVGGEVQLGHGHGGEKLEAPLLDGHLLARPAVVSNSGDLHMRGGLGVNDVLLQVGTHEEQLGQLRAERELAHRRARARRARRVQAVLGVTRLERERRLSRPDPELVRPQPRVVAHRGGADVLARGERREGEEVRP